METAPATPTEYAPVPVDLDLEVGTSILSNGLTARIEVAPLDLDLDLGVTLLGIATTPGDYPNPDDAPGYVARVVNMRGELLEEIPHVLAVRVTDELNTPQDFAFALPKYLPSTAAVRPLATEVQLYRNDDLIAWGPVLTRAGSGAEGAMTYAAKGVLWYFLRRFFGTIQRTQLLRNGDFEVAGSWATFGGVGFTRSTAQRLLGTRSARLTAPAGVGRGIRQSFGFAPSTATRIVHLAAWVWIDPDAWTGPAGFGVGATISRRAAGAPEAEATAVLSIDAGTPRGEWVLLSTPFRIPVGPAWEIDVRLYAQGGTTYWDAVQVVQADNTGTGSAGTDQDRLARWIIAHAQTTRGKSSVAVGSRANLTGVERRRRWDHHLHDPIEAGLKELVEIEEGLDFGIELTPTTRTFTTYFPRAGTDRRAEVELVFPADLISDVDVGRYALSGHGYGEDGSQTATSVIALGPGDGPTRLEGGAIDATALDGLVLERVVDAPDNVPPSELNAYAGAILEEAKNTVETLTLTTSSGDLIELLEVGDLVAVTVDDGAIQVAGGYRIVRKTLTSRPESLELIVTRWDEV